MTIRKFLATVLVVAAVGQTRADDAYAITVAGLTMFNTATPGTFTTPIAITGLNVGHSLRSIDFRPANGQLYGMSINLNSLTESQLYTIDLTTAVATPVGGTITLTGNTSDISIDFNPVVDRLRVVGFADQNYRVNPITGTLVLQDTNITPSTATVVAIAYDNNFAGATSTTLYGYEFQTDTLVRIGSAGGTPNSPNGGVLETIGGTGGPSAFDGFVSFDIGTTGNAFVSLDDAVSPTAASEFYSVDLATGALTLIDDEVFQILDFALVPVPEPATLTLTGVAIVGAIAGLRRRNRA